MSSEIENQSNIGMSDSRKRLELLQEGVKSAIDREVILMKYEKQLKQQKKLVFWLVLVASLMITVCLYQDTRWKSQINNILLDRMELQIEQMQKSIESKNALQQDTIQK